jgi:hypothetical protein
MKLQNKNKSNKKFGVLFFIIFLLIGFWPILKGENLDLLYLGISFIFLFLTFINSSILTPLNLIWIKFGELLGRIVSPIVMSFIYFLIITPIGLILRIFGKDILGLKFSSKKSYWINRTKNIETMKNQF